MSQTNSPGHNSSPKDQEENPETGTRTPILKVWEDGKDFHKFSYGPVVGKIDISIPDQVIIYEFFCHNPGKGHAATALNVLKEKYKAIIVTDIGQEDEDTYQFWIHCIHKGLVDTVYDEIGTELSQEYFRQRPHGVPWKELLPAEAKDTFPLTDRWKTITGEHGLIAIQSHPKWTDLCACQNGRTLYLATVSTETYGEVFKNADKSN